MTNGESRISNLQPALRNLLLPASILLLGTFALSAFALNSPGGVPLDDAWIHFQFARNLAHGDGFSFNPGQPTAGSTSPLWTLLLAGVYLAGGRFPIAGQVLSSACFLAALAATYALARQLTGNRWLAWLAGMVVALNGRMVWAGLAGLETCLFAALSLSAIAAHLRDRTNSQHRPLAAALFGLAALARPEGYLLFALAIADLTFHALRVTHHASRIMPHVLRIARSVFLFTVIVAPYLIFSLWTSGHLLPNTYHAKATASLLPDRDSLSVAATYLILDNPLLLPFVLLGGLMLLKRAPLLSLWSAGLPLGYAFLHTALYQHGRYLMPLIPSNAVLGVVGLLHVQQLALRRWPDLTARIPRAPGNPDSLGAFILRAFVSLLIIAGTAWRLPYMAGQYAWNVDNINQMHVALGEWIKAHTPPDALLALNDIGAITYVSERPIIDLAGLVTPEIVPILRSPDRDARLAEFLAEQDVQYVVIFPTWFPGLAADPALEPVYQVTLERNTIAGGQTMVVCRTHWRR